MADFMPLAWEESKFGEVVTGFLDCLVFVHIPNLNCFREIESFGSKTTTRYECFEDIDSPSDKSPPPSPATDTTITTDLTGGLVALQNPKRAHEKRKKRLPQCFIFGRSAIADIRFGGNRSKAGVSGQHFALGLWKGRWAVKNLSTTGTLVHNAILLKDHGSVLALIPGQANDIQLGNNENAVKLIIYCRHPSAWRKPSVDDDMMDLGISEFREPSEATATTASLEDDDLRSADMVMYFLDQIVPSRTPIRKIVAMDPWTADLYVAKLYPLSAEHQVRSRLSLLAQVPGTLSSPFIRELYVIKQDGKLAALVMKREGISTLNLISETLSEEADQVVYTAARRLLWNMLRIVGKLHNLQIAHNDICLETVFANDNLDMEMVFLGGFSESKPLKDESARRDCLRIFEIVGKLLGDRVTHLPTSWLANEYLDALWCEYRASSQVQNWQHSVQEICNKIQIDTELRDEVWTDIRVSKELSIQRMIQDGEESLKFEDFRNYAIINAIYNSKKTNEAIDIARQQTLESIARYAPKGEYISLTNVTQFIDHLRKRHHIFLDSGGIESAYPSGKRRRISKCSKEERAIVISLAFAVPYNIRYGLVSLTRLHSLALPSYDFDKLKDLLGRCFEVQGFAGGIYVPIDAFPRVAEELGLSYHSEDISNREASPIDGCTYKSWFLLAPNESSEIFPVERGPAIVHMSSGNCTLEEFVMAHMPGLQLQSFDAETLFQRASPAPAHSCLGDNCTSVFSSEDPMAFKFGRRRAPKQLEAEADMGHIDRTEEWILGLRSRR